MLVRRGRMGVGVAEKPARGREKRARAPILINRKSSADRPIHSRLTPTPCTRSRSDELPQGVEQKQNPASPRSMSRAHTQTDRQTDRHTHTHTQTDRQTDRHTHTHTHRQTDKFSCVYFACWQFLRHGQIWLCQGNVSHCVNTARFCLHED